MKNPMRPARIRHRGPAFLLLAALASALPAAQGPVGAGPPETGRPEKILLASGQECLYQRDGASAITVIEIFVPGGKNAVPPGQDGLAYLATRMALEIPDFSVAQDIMAQATRMSLAVLEDGSVIRIECLSDNLEAALRVASGIIQKPLITGLRIDNIKRGMDLFAKAKEDDAADTGHAAALGAFFQGRGYGSANYGTEASLRAIDRKAVTDFLAGHLTRTGVYYSVCSDLDRGRIQALLEKYLSGFASGEASSPPPAPASVPGERKVILERDLKQSYVARACLLPPASVPAFAKGCLLEVLLGVGPGSRLWRLRAGERLAYNVGARTTWTRGSGLLEAYLETANAQSERAVAALDGVLAALLEKGVSQEELRMTKNLARGHLLRSLEAKIPRAEEAGLWRLLGLGTDGLPAVLERIESVTAEELDAFIAEVLDPGRSLLVVVGGRRDS
jgi:zinc protease